MNALISLPARKASKNSTVEFTPCLNNYSRVAGVAMITTDRAACTYIIEETPDDMPGVRYFILSKLGDDGTDPDTKFYHVRCRPALPEITGCSCKGMQYKGTCKHIDSVHALISSGVL